MTIIFGTNAADLLTGAIDKDVIYGLGGNDVILGTWGDYLIGGQGDDTLYVRSEGVADGGEGADNLYVLGANDTYTYGAKTVGSILIDRMTVAGN